MTKVNMRLFTIFVRNVERKCTLPPPTGAIHGTLYCSKPPPGAEAWQERWLVPPSGCSLCGWHSCGKRNMLRRSGEESDERHNQVCEINTG